MAQQGLGLMQALGAYQQGRAWRDNQQNVARQQEQLAEQKAREDKIKAANQAAISYLDESKKAHDAEQAKALEDWTRTKGSGEGFQAKPWQTNDAVMFRAAAARGDALLQGGLFDEYAKNRAAIIPMQMQARKAAWERFQTDGDHGALGQAMYDTVPNGKHVKAYDVAEAPGPDGKTKGKKLRFHMDDGTVQFMAPEQVEALAKRAMTDPQKVMENEFALDLWKAKEKVRAEGNKDVNTHKHGLSMLEIQERNKGSKDVAEVRADASEKVATIRGPSKGSGGSGGGSKGSNVQSVQTDKDGYKVIVFRDGTTKPMSMNGKPVRAQDWSKRVDKLAKDLGSTLGGFKKSPEELRAQAETMLAGEAAPTEDVKPTDAPKPTNKPGVKFLGFEK
jgi:hypothetical protein